MEKIWITGAKGRLGGALCAGLDPQRYTLLATDRDTVDVTRMEAVAGYAAENRPDIIINCTGFNDESGCQADPDRAYLVNALGARNLAAQARRIGARMVQISTDDVFAQPTDQPYTEFDTPSPSSIYGRSKLEGERLVAQQCPDHLILRSSWVYGAGRDFVSAILEAAADPNCPWMAAATNRVASPTSAAELVRAIGRLLDTPAIGVYHVVCQGGCSRYDFAREILRLTHNEDKLKLHPIRDEAAASGDYTVLDNMMLRLEGMEPPKPWRQALKEYLAAR